MHKQTMIAERIHQIKGVEEAIPVYGVFDCVVTTEKTDSKNDENQVLSQIRSMKDVLTVLVLKNTSVIHSHE